MNLHELRQQKAFENPYQRRVSQFPSPQEQRYDNIPPQQIIYLTKKQEQETPWFVIIMGVLFVAVASVGVLFAFDVISTKKTIQREIPIAQIPPSSTAPVPIAQQPSMTTQELCSYLKSDEGRAKYKNMQYETKKENDKISEIFTIHDDRFLLKMVITFTRSALNPSQGDSIQIDIQKKNASGQYEKLGKKDVDVSVVGGMISGVDANVGTSSNQITPKETYQAPTRQSQQQLFGGSNYVPFSGGGVNGNNITTRNTLLPDKVDPLLKKGKKITDIFGDNTLGHGTTGLKTFFFKEQESTERDPFFKLLTKYNGNFLNDYGVVKGLISLDRDDAINHRNRDHILNMQFLERQRMENPIEKRRATDQILRNFVEGVIADKLKVGGLDGLQDEMPDDELLDAIKNFSIDGEGPLVSNSNGMQRRGKLSRSALQRGGDLSYNDAQRLQSMRQNMPHGKMSYGVGGMSVNGVSSSGVSNAKVYPQNINKSVRNMGNAETFEIRETPQTRENFQQGINWGKDPIYGEYNVLPEELPIPSPPQLSANGINSSNLVQWQSGDQAVNIGAQNQGVQYSQAVDDARGTIWAPGTLSTQAARNVAWQGTGDVWAGDNSNSISSSGPIGIDWGTVKNSQMFTQQPEQFIGEGTDDVDGISSSNIASWQPWDRTMIMSPAPQGMSPNVQYGMPIHEGYEQGNSPVNGQGAINAARGTIWAPGSLQTQAAKDISWQGTDVYGNIIPNNGPIGIDWGPDPVIGFNGKEQMSNAQMQELLRTDEERRRRMLEREANLNQGQINEGFISASENQDQNMIEQHLDTEEQYSESFRGGGARGGGGSRGNGGMRSSGMRSGGMRRSNSVGRSTIGRNTINGARGLSPRVSGQSSNPSFYGMKKGGVQAHQPGSNPSLNRGNGTRGRGRRPNNNHSGGRGHSGGHYNRYKRWGSCDSGYCGSYNNYYYPPYNYLSSDIYNPTFYRPFYYPYYAYPYNVSLGDFYNDYNIWDDGNLYGVPLGGTQTNVDNVPAHDTIVNKALRQAYYQDIDGVNPSPSSNLTSNDYYAQYARPYGSYFGSLGNLDTRYVLDDQDVLSFYDNKNPSRAINPLENPDFLDVRSRARYVENNPNTVNGAPKFEAFQQENYSNGDAAMGALMQLNQQPSVASYFSNAGGDVGAATGVNVINMQDIMADAAYSKAHNQSEINNSSIVPNGAIMHDGNFDAIVGNVNTPLKQSAITLGNVSDPRYYNNIVHGENEFIIPYQHNNLWREAPYVTNLELDSNGRQIPGIGMPDKSTVTQAQAKALDIKEPFTMVCSTLNNPDGTMSAAALNSIGAMAAYANKANNYGYAIQDPFAWATQPTQKQQDRQWQQRMQSQKQWLPEWQGQQTPLQRELQWQQWLSRPFSWGQHNIQNPMWTNGTIFDRNSPQYLSDISSMTTYAPNGVCLTNQCRGRCRCLQSLRYSPGFSEISSSGTLVKTKNNKDNDTKGITSSGLKQSFTQSPCTQGSCNPRTLKNLPYALTYNQPCVMRTNSLGMEREPLDTKWNIKQNVFDVNGRQKTYGFNYTGGAGVPGITNDDESVYNNNPSAIADAIGDRAAKWSDYRYAEGAWSPQQQGFDYIENAVPGAIDYRFMRQQQNYAGDTEAEEKAQTAANELGYFLLGDKDVDKNDMNDIDDAELQNKYNLGPCVGGIMPKPIPQDTYIQRFNAMSSGNKTYDKEVEEAKERQEFLNRIVQKLRACSGRFNKMPLAEMKFYMGDNCDQIFKQYGIESFDDLVMMVGQNNAFFEQYVQR